VSGYTITIKHLALTTFHPITNNDEIGAGRWMAEKKGHSPMKETKPPSRALPPGTNDGGPLVAGTEASVNGSGS